MDKQTKIICYFLYRIWKAIVRYEGNETFGSMCRVAMLYGEDILND